MGVACQAKARVFCTEMGEMQEGLKELPKRLVEDLKGALKRLHTPDPSA